MDPRRVWCTKFLTCGSTLAKQVRNAHGDFWNQSPNKKISNTTVILQWPMSTSSIHKRGPQKEKQKKKKNTIAYGNVPLSLKRAFFSFEAHPSQSRFGTLTSIIFCKEKSIFDEKVLSWNSNAIMKKKQLLFWE